MKRKTQERRTSIPATTITDNNNNMSLNESGSSRNGTKKCSFQFSDDDDDTNQSDMKKKNNKDDDDDDGGTTESYEVENDNEDNRNQNNGNIKNEEVEEEDEEDSSPTKRNSHGGRKNIRKIIEDQELDIQTKHAVEEELERRKRISEKQKEYNDNLLEQSTYISHIENEEKTNVNRRLILELDQTTNEPLIEVSPKLVHQLKPHQCDGIRFLWNNVFESIDAIQNKKQQGNGCILAHCMGLGKTLQVISFIHTIFNYDQITNIRTCLVLCPINAGKLKDDPKTGHCFVLLYLALNWTNEFEYWLTDVEPPVDHYQLTTIKPNLRVTHLNYWYEHGGVMIMGYEMYRRLANGVGLKNKKLKAQAYKCLVDPGPDIVGNEIHQNHLR